MTAHALYLHIPFCQHRCAYCDFNTYAGKTALIPAYVASLLREIELVSASRQINAKSIFFGGGTPSLLSSSQLASLMEALRAKYTWTDDLEASLEANPGTLSRDYLQKLRKMGFNRLSFGVQSAHPDDLHLLERIHDFVDVIHAVKWARQAGFDNLSLDLIFGLPEQPLSRWQDTLKYALDLQTEHLSLYALTIEHGTPFGHWAGRGMIPFPDPDLSADMYDWASEFLAENGYIQYEISNWAKPGWKSQHNLQYWRNLPYLGFGAGAHGYSVGTRYANTLGIQPYIHRLQKKKKMTFPRSPASVSKEDISPYQAMQETMMLGLRLTQEGVSAEMFRSRFGRSVEDVFSTEIEVLFSLKLLEWADVKNERVLRLTPRARLLGNQVFRRFVG